MEDQQYKLEDIGLCDVLNTFLVACDCGDGLCVCVCVCVGGGGGGNTLNTLMKADEAKAIYVAWLYTCRASLWSLAAPWILRREKRSLKCPRHCISTPALPWMTWYKAWGREREKGRCT